MLPATLIGKFKGSNVIKLLQCFFVQYLKCEYI